jgi:transcriptional regulator with XRE-family HTH domain
VGYPSIGCPTHGVGRTTIHTEEHRALIQLLREARLKAGLTQAALSERLGRPQSFISKLENGERRIDLVELRVLCRELGEDVASLVRKWDRRLK